MVTVCGDCGDFNIHHIEWTNEIVVTDLPMHEATLAIYVINNGLTQFLKEPTHKNILNLLLISDPLAIYDVTVSLHSAPATTML